MARPDMEQRLALDRRLVHVIGSADADLSVEQKILLSRAVRLLERDRPLNPELRLELERIYEILPELVSND